MSPPSAASRPRVLLDVTPLRTLSGWRGIGRYIVELLYGLEETRSHWADRVELMALHDLTANGRGYVEYDLRKAADEAWAARDTISTSTLRWRRRWHLDRVAIKAKADLLHETEALGTPLGRRIPRIVTCHDLIPLRYPRHYLDTPLAYPLRWFREHRRYHQATRIVAISERTRADLVQLLGIPVAKIDWVPSGLTLPGGFATEQDNAFRAALGVGGRPYALYVGYGDYRKNVEGMFGALALARASVDVELVWAGALEPALQTALLAQASAAGVASAIRFLGFVPDETLYALYRGAAAHLFLSRLEGFGLSVVEAMALGCPVIVARRSGTDELAGDGGVVVDADDALSAAEALVRLIRDPGERTRLGALGRVRAALYSRGAMAQGYVESYHRAQKFALM